MQVMRHSVRRATRLVIGMACVAMFATVLNADVSHPPLQSSSGTFTRLHPIEPVPDKAVIALDGSIQDLRQFRGRVLVLNFWATWCAACLHELPALDRLATDFQGWELTVAGVSIDEDGYSAVLPFLNLHPLTQVAIFLDPSQELGSRFLEGEKLGALPVLSLPMTYFIDRKGGVLGYISGAVEWDSDEARTFVRDLLGREQI